MSIETKQLHALSKIYQEAVYGGAKKKSTDMVVTNADKKANTPAYKNYKAGVKGYKAADHMKEGMKQARKNVGADKCWDGYKAKGTKKKGGKEVPNCVEEGKKAAKDYDGDGKIESGKEEYFGSKDKAIKKAMGKKIKEGMSNWRQDLKEIPDYDQIPVDSKKSNEKISEKKVKNTVKINPTMEEGYGKKKKHDCASKVKHEQFGVGDCISEAHDLDENGNVAHYDVEFEEYIVKNVPVGELEILEKHMHEHVIHTEEKKVKNCGCGQNPCVTYGKQEQKESYETKKTGEVLSAFKRDPKVRKRFEKAAKKEGGPGSAKNRAADDMLQTAKDTAKRKGDTSKSDDRYAYESKLWDEVADNLTQLGELNDADFRVEGYQRNPERDTRSARQRRMDDPDTGINSQAFRDFMAAQQRPAKKKPVAKKKDSK